ncbi:branched-chain amino acid ABC transporter permease [Hyphomicrobium sp. CS1BSMeth3]|uniref:branched-chain amino acid ABC transporter permease n=1 Tax=Hyphomicrobium sp. CS1BSMeth3 TaxID=1892844 RepID=UPI00093039F8|nr:branched-chain amino acid ABC transporter permease [Hyphomicrobium sp. CS1BSMeth3]
MDTYVITVLSNIGMISFVALSAYILLLSGQISFGQQAYFGIGAYTAGIATVMWQWPIAGALVLGALAASVAAGLVGLATLRLSGIYFAMATLAFAEIMRIAAELFVYRREIGGVETGPDGIDGFRDIRYFFANDISPFQSCLIVYALLAAVLAALFIVERTRGGRLLRQVGEDPLLAEVQGIDVMRVRMAAALSAGAVAGLGGGLYAHLMTYVEPRSFDIMLGVHALAYGLIGGLGTALGPLLGVLIDIGLLESTRIFRGYRMIVFGGLVAVLLIVRPRGLLDEVAISRIRQALRRRRHAGG